MINLGYQDYPKLFKYFSKYPLSFFKSYLIDSLLHLSKYQTIIFRELFNHFIIIKNSSNYYISYISQLLSKISCFHFVYKFILQN